jgi:hypothetical protein
MGSQKESYYLSLCHGASLSTSVFFPFALTGDAVVALPDGSTALSGPAWSSSGSLRGSRGGLSVAWPARGDLALPGSGIWVQRSTGVLCLDCSGDDAWAWLIPAGLPLSSNPAERSILVTGHFSEAGNFWHPEVENIPCHRKKKSLFQNISYVHSDQDSRC